MVDFPAPEGAEMMKHTPRRAMDGGVVAAVRVMAVRSVSLPGLLDVLFRPRLDGSSVATF
ncbi:hypothetical protein AA0472_3101 [Acetobacter estunensis NRIC 0472]|nr:hypothetical protein AA0472_3101 [Acetobacter estunensis NRIC 0472]